MNSGAQAGIEFVVYVVGGALAGWGLDRALASSPWLLLLGFGLGTACGFWRVFRIEKDLAAGDPSALQKALKTSTNPENSTDED